LSSSTGVERAYLNRDFNMALCVGGYDRVEPEIPQQLEETSSWRRGGAPSSLTVSPKLHLSLRVSLS
jgi:hypothetical protein